MTAEPLVAIALLTGRSKDHVRILQVLEIGAVDRKSLEAILVRYDLLPKWRVFLAKYLEK